MNIQDFHQLQEAYVNIYEKRRSEESGEDYPEVNEKNERRQKLERKKKDKERYHQESVDYYDLVLSHLLDEGYADSEANAEIIMVNMSEEWLDEIIEATAMAKRDYNIFHADQRGVKKVKGSKSQWGYDKEGNPSGKYLELKHQKKEQKAHKDSEEIHRRNREIADYSWQKESVDYYNLVLSHLLDEGYADSEDNAEIIMVNMSEEWLDEILNEVVGMGSKIDPKTGKYAPDFETDLKYKDGWKDNRTKSQRAYDDKTPTRSKYVKGTTGSQYREFQKSKDPGLAMTPGNRMKSRANSLSRRPDVESRRRGSKIERIRQNLGLG